jgi:hypothetical protein
MANPNPYFQYTVGLNNVGSYQASSRPWIKSHVSVPISGATATATEISFPKVTKFVTIRNDATGSGSELRVAFSRGALDESKNNFFTLAQSSSISLEYRVTKVYLLSEGAYLGTASVIAGLTQIDASHLSDSWLGLDGNGG